MIKFEKYYDGIQTHIQAISTEETKNNGNIDCCYTVGKYIKEEIEDLQNKLQQKENIIKEVREIFKYYGNKEDIVGYANYTITGESLLELLEILDKGE